MDVKFPGSIFNLKCSMLQEENMFVDSSGVAGMTGEGGQGDTKHCTVSSYFF